MRIAMRPRSGMTLMEITVTLFITVLVAATAALTFSMMISSDKKLKGTALQTERAAAVRDLIRSWITTGTITPDSGGVAGQTSIGGSGGRGGRGGGSLQTSQVAGDTGVSTAQGISDELRFTTSALTPVDAPNVFMRLFIADDASVPEHGLSLEFQPQTTPATPLRRIQLDTTIGNMTVSYFDAKTSLWYPAVQVSSITAVAVKFTLGPIDSTVAWDSLPHLLYLPFIFRMGNPQDSLTQSTRGAGGGGRGGRGG